MIVREYISGVRHVLYDAESRFEGDLPWADGEGYLKKIETYRKAHAACTALPPR